MTRSRSADPAIEAPLLDPAEVAALLHQGGRTAVWPESRVRPTQGRVGEHSAGRLGSGLDYAETRVYQAGDDPRHVHWRATARSGALQVRRYHQDVSPRVCLVVDRGAGMRFGTRRRLKVTQAARLALLLAAQEVRQGAELAALIQEPPRRWLPAAVGAIALRRLAASVTAPAPPLPPAGEDDASPVFGELAQRLEPGARVYLISDFRGLREADVDALSELGRRFEVRALAVYDPVERELPAVGPLRLQWGGVRVSTDGRDPAQRARHAAAWGRFRAQLQRHLAGAGIVGRFVSSQVDDLATALAEDADGP